MTEPPRFNGLHRGRVQLRLVVAAGMLVGLAIATGGLASAFASPSTPEPEPAPLGSMPPTAAHPMIEVELRVREAEATAARARAALRDARSLEPDERASFEERLEHLGTSPLESVRRGYETELDGEPDKSQRRSLKAIASPAREL